MGVIARWTIYVRKDTGELWQGGSEWQTPHDFSQWQAIEVEPSAITRGAIEAQIERLRDAGTTVDRAWDAWMSSDDDDGFDAVVDAIGSLRAALDTP